MKLSDDLRRALRQAAEEENAVPPHEFSETHEQQMQALFERNPSHKRLWLRIAVPLAACLAIVTLIGWQADRQLPPADDPTGTPATTTGTALPDGGGAVDFQIPSENDAAGNSSHQVCIFAESVTVTAVAEHSFTAMPNAEFPNEFADVAVTEFVVYTATADYAVGDRLFLSWKAGDWRLEGTRCYVTPTRIDKEE